MKPLRALTPLLTSLLLVSSGWSQNGLVPKDVSSDDGGDQIAVARRAYTQNEDNSYDADGAMNLHLAHDQPEKAGSQTLAKGPRCRSQMPPPYCCGYCRSAYPIPRMASGGAGHALIGAAIGFGIGATVGSIGSAHNGTSVGGGAIIGGGLLGFIGAAIGAASDGPHWFMHRRRLDPRTWHGDQDPWDEDDEESSRRSHPKSPQDHVELVVSSRPVPDKQPGDVDATVAPSRALPAVP
jgi:hypothetical protein